MSYLYIHLGIFIYLAEIMFRSLKLVLLATAALALVPVGEAAAATLTGAPPIVIGHRGASGYRPEHTLAAYELAIDMGADYIEPDVVSTKDGVLIARHENEISGTTDVSSRPEFADRYTTKIIDGAEVEGWFTEDFTLAEIKTLRAKERLPQLRSTAYDGLYEVPTLQEVIDLAKRKSAETGRTIGIYPETKHPTYFNSVGLSLEEPLVEILTANGYTDADDAVFIQSFEVANLQRLNTLTNVSLVQLFGGSGSQPYDFVVSGDSRTYGDLVTSTGLAGIAEYAQGIGPSKGLIIPSATVDRDGDGKADDLNGDGVISDADRPLKEPTTLIDDAHAAGLLVHAYTFRNEDFFLAPEYNGNPELEYERFFKLGLDGLFSDFPDTAVAVRNRVAGNPNQAVPEPSSLAILGILPLAEILRRRHQGGKKAKKAIASS
jgi:glycerophosphoryl diester phosphodiesterase